MTDVSRSYGPDTDPGDTFLPQMGGQPAAVLVNAEELAEMDEAIALASYREAQAAGDVHLIDHQDARARLGLDGATGSPPR